MPNKRKKTNKYESVKLKKPAVNASKGVSEVDRLRAEITVLQKQVNILQAISEITAKDFKLSEILDRFLTTVMDATSSEAGSILLVEKHTNALYFASAKGGKASQIKKFKLAIGEGVAGWVAQTGKPIITPDAASDKRHSGRFDKNLKYKTRNIMCAPLKFDHDILGVIEMLNKKKGQAFDNRDLETLLIFTPYISAIVKNAGLLTDNKEKIERLEHLMGITEYVNSTLELDILLDKMLAASTHMLEAEAGSILLLEKDELVFASATGAQKDTIKNIRVPIGEGIAGWVAREDRSVLVADAQNDPRFFKKADEKTSFKTRSIIAVPLKTKQKLVGVMEVMNKKGGDFFNEDDKNLLEALANQAAVAIENAKLYTETQNMFMNTVKCLAETIDKKDNYTRHHSDGVTTYSMEIGKALGIPDVELKELKIAALFHDIGKIGVNESILRKPSKLTEQEFLEIKKHPDEGANILEPIPQLKDILPVIRHHHERFDGNGYPAGLVGEDIPMHSRIISIADTLDAMLTDRPYRKGLPLETCVQEIQHCSGTQFDPEIVPVAIKAIKKYFSKKVKK
ncbi:MAG: GAF domain-containing protein [Candidatus Goldbacteria bacterium]|nr:GAF domain-containing protein [Candidatus Goldiibacteriota bacterium]